MTDVVASIWDGTPQNTLVEPPLLQGGEVQPPSTPEVLDARQPPGPALSSSLAAGIAAGDAQEVRELLAAGADASGAFSGTSFVLLGARAGAYEAVRLLLDAGASASVTDEAGRTGLHLAATSGLAGRHAVVWVLAAHGAPLSARDGDGYTPLMRAAAAGDAAMVDTLLEQGAPVDDALPGSGATALTEASRLGLADVVRVLLAAGADASRVVARGPRRRVAFSAASASRRFDWREALDWTNDLLVDWNDDDVVIAAAGDDDDGAQPPRSALEMAVAGGHAETAAALLRPGGAPPFGLAVVRGHNETFAALCGERPGGVAWRPDADGATALGLAALLGRADYAAALLRLGAPPDQQGAGGEAPLHVAARCGEMAVAAALLAGGASPHVLDARLQTPLHLAARHGHADLVAALLAAGASLHQQDTDNRSPLLEGAARRHFDVVDELLAAAVARLRAGDAGAVEAVCIGRQVSAAFVLLAALGADGPVRRLLDARDSTALEPPVAAALLMAAQSGRCAVVELLLAQGGELLAGAALVAAASQPAGCPECSAEELARTAAALVAHADLHPWAPQFASALAVCRGHAALFASLLPRAAAPCAVAPEALPLVLCVARGSWAELSPELLAAAGAAVDCPEFWTAVALLACQADVDQHAFELLLGCEPLAGALTCESRAHQALLMLAVAAGNDAALRRLHATLPRVTVSGDRMLAEVDSGVPEADLPCTRAAGPPGDELEASALLALDSATARMVPLAAAGACRVAAERLRRGEDEADQPLPAGLSDSSALLRAVLGSHLAEAAAADSGAVVDVILRSGLPLRYVRGAAGEEGAKPLQRPAQSSALAAAAITGAHAALDRLLPLGVGCAEGPERLVYPLAAAIEGGHVDVLRRLIAAGAPVDTPAPVAMRSDGRGPTPPTDAPTTPGWVLVGLEADGPEAPRRADSCEEVWAALGTAERVCGACAPSPRPLAPLQVAAYYGRADAVDALLAAGADASVMHAGLTALMVAAAKGHAGALRALLRGGAAPFQSKDVHVTALLYAAVRGSCECVDELLTHEPVPQEPFELAVSAAVACGQTAVLERLLPPARRTPRLLSHAVAVAVNGSERASLAALLRMGAPLRHLLLPNAAQRWPDDPRTLWWMAFAPATPRTEELLDALLPRDGPPRDGALDAWIAAASFPDLQILFSFCHSVGERRVLDALQASRRFRTVLDIDGDSFLVCIARDSALDQLKAYLDFDDDVNRACRPNGAAWTALDYAAEQAQHAAFKTLVGAGADPTGRPELELFHAVTTQRWPEVRRRLAARPSPLASETLRRWMLHVFVDAPAFPLDSAATPLPAAERPSERQRDAIAAELIVDLDFDAKVRLFHSRLAAHAMQPLFGSASPSAASTRDGLTVTREGLVADTLEFFTQMSAKQVADDFSVTFAGEDGYDAGGLRRELFHLATRGLLQPEAGLFAEVPEHSGRFQPSVAALQGAPPEECERRFAALGRLVAKLLHDEQQFNGRFTIAFLRHMLDLPLGLSDLAEVDPELHRHLCAYADGPSLDMDFVVEERGEGGQLAEIELKPGGRSIKVSGDGKAEYAALLAKHKVSDARLEPFIRAFQRALWEAVPLRLLAPFSPEELDRLVSGAPEIDVDDLIANTAMCGFEDHAGYVGWFHTVLRSLSQQELGAFVQFVTGSSAVPAQGFRAKEITVQRGTDGLLLPSAHTCGLTLVLPVYESEAELKRRLTICLQHSCGFGFM